jgi:hypothetical protein
MCLPHQKKDNKSALYDSHIQQCAECMSDAFVQMKLDVDVSLCSKELREALNRGRKNRKYYEKNSEKKRTASVEDSFLHPIHPADSSSSSQAAKKKIKGKVCYYCHHFKNSVACF